MTFAEKLKSIRKQAGLSQEQLAERPAKKPDKQTTGIYKSLLNGCSVQGVGCSPTLSR